jgi:autotransporter-associated beta strand protein
MKPKSSLRNLLTAIGSSLLAISSSHAQTNGDWNVNAAGNWSDATNWTSNPTVPGGAGSIINLTNDITANRTVTINTDSRTVGTLNIGDSDNTHAFTLAASGGASLIFNNNGSGASIIESGSIRDFISAPIILADNLTTTIGGSLQLSGNITESGGARSITKDGAGSLLLAGNNTFSGGVTLNAGQINIGSDGALGTGTFTINGGRVDIAGTGSGTTVTTTNNNIWNANWTMGRGSTGTGTWNNNGNILLGANVTVSSANNFTVLNLGGVISDGGNNRSLALNATTVTLSGANTYGGGTSFTGILNINHAQALGTGALTVTGNTRTINNTSGSAITLSNNNALNLANTLIFTGSNNLNFGTGAVTLQGGNRTVQVDAGILTFGGAVGQDSGARQLIKTGDGTLVLGGNNSYLGATLVNAGTLLINGNSSTATGNVTVATGATLGGSGTIGGATTVNGSLNPGNSPGVLEFESGLTLGSTSTTTMEILGINRGSQYDGVDVTGGTLTYGGVLVLDLQTLFGGGSYTFNLFDAINPASGEFSSIAFAGAFYSGSFSDDGFGVWSASTNSGNESWIFDHNDGNLYLNVIPEPKTALLGAIGFLMLFRRRR